MGEDDEPLGDLRADVEGRSTRSGDDAGGDRTASGEDRDEGTEGDPGPLEELRSAVDARRREEDAEAHFAEMDVGDLDEEEVWTDLLLEDGPSEGSFPPTATAEADDGPIHVVTKQLCHNCEHFGDPPTLHCTHDGTEILALVDMDHYRVSDCPMVDRDAGDF
ncbi:MAG: hypothetical protein ABEJ77_01575 [Halanaeroarchaeum sp.]